MHVPIEKYVLRAGAEWYHRMLSCRDEDCASGLGCVSVAGIDAVGTEYGGWTRVVGGGASISGGIGCQSRGGIGRTNLNESFPFK